MAFDLMGVDVKYSANILAKAHLNELEKRLSKFVEEGKDSIKKITKRFSPDFNKNKKEYVECFRTGLNNIDKEFNSQIYLEYLNQDERDNYRLKLDEITSSKLKELESYKLND